MSFPPHLLDELARLFAGAASTGSFKSRRRESRDRMTAAVTLRASLSRQTD
jgi:hypothetical protein